MIERIRDWLDICKVHWKEIFALSFLMHFVMDLLLIGPAFFLLGYFFGTN
jgi:hypothetical protein